MRSANQGSICRDTRKTRLNLHCLKWGSVANWHLPGYEDVVPDAAVNRDREHAQSEAIAMNQDSLTKGLFRFLGGAACGAFLVSIPGLYGASVDWGLLQIGIATLMVIASGGLATLWGEKFIDAVMRTLNGFAP